VVARLLVTNSVILFSSLDFQLPGAEHQSNAEGFSRVLLHVNVLAVLVAAIIQWVFGYLWYGLLFKKDYKALAQSGGGATPNPGGVMALIFIANLIVSFALAKMIPLTGWMTFGKGSLVGAICGLGFVVPPMFAGHISEGKPFKLFGINALYWLIAMYLSGGILAVWQ
jgi:hypothetical protein